MFYIQLLNVKDNVKVAYFLYMIYNLINVLRGVIYGENSKGYF